MIYNKLFLKFHNFAKSLLSKYIIYTKIIQWINFDFINFLGSFGTEINKFLKSFTDNAPYVDDDIDYESLNKLRKLGEKYNIEINEKPINSGTISLVFEGYINQKDKRTKLAIKILRNGIESKIHSAISSLMYISKLLNNFQYFRKLNLIKTINDIQDCLIEQVDFEKERNSIKLFDLKLNKNKSIKTVKLIDELSFENVITMEFIEGRSVFKLNDEEKRNYCNMLIPAIFFIQIKKGLYHMDLHPGNIMYTDDSKLSFLDLGMIEKLSTRESNFIIDYFEIIISNDRTIDLIHRLIYSYQDLVFEDGDFDINFIDTIFQRYPHLYKNKNAKDQIYDTQIFITNLNLSGCKVTKRINRILFGFLSFLNLFTIFDSQIQGLLMEKVKAYRCE